EKQRFKYATIQGRKRFEIGDSDALVQLVDGGIDGTNFDDLGADLANEAPVGGTAAARDFGGDTADFAHRVGRDCDEPPARGEVRPSRGGPLEIVLETMPAQHRLEARRKALARARSRIAEVEGELQRAGNDIGCTGAGVNVRCLP